MFHNLLVVQVCLEARFGQELRVVQHALEICLQLCQMMTGWVQGDLEVLEALVDQEDPDGKRLFRLFALSKMKVSGLSLWPFSYPDEYSVTVQVFKPRTQGISSIL